VAIDVTEATCPNANARALFTTLRYADHIESALRDADLVLLLTEWEEFRQLDPEPLGEVLAKRRILDGRNALDPGRWRAAGCSYRALGRP
jgi:UDPglucose 6-dehydrogenase